MAGGRPTKYNDEMVTLAEDYIVNFGEYGDAVPTIAGLACEIGISRDTVYAWMAEPEKQAFSDIAKQLMTHQERKLTNGSLSNQLNPMIAKLMLSKHGYSDKQEIDHSGKIDSTRSIKVISAEMSAEEATRIYQDMINGKD
ncbi:MAG TPA: hypothetical protein DDW91_17800 [Shewanella frigidimarina]|nr:hypothetical protein [Shewanella frigidimarina]